jgi:hypothetical protein
MAGKDPNGSKLEVWEIIAIVLGSALGFATFLFCFSQFAHRQMVIHTSEKKVAPFDSLRTIQQGSSRSELDAHPSNIPSKKRSTNNFDTNNPYEILMAESRYADELGPPSNNEEAFVPRTAHKLDRHHLQENMHSEMAHNHHDSTMKKMPSVNDEQFQDHVEREYNVLEATQIRQFHVQQQQSHPPHHHTHTVNHVHHTTAHPSTEHISHTHS